MSANTSSWFGWRKQWIPGHGFCIPCKLSRVTNSFTLSVFMWRINRLLFGAELTARSRRKEIVGCDNVSYVVGGFHFVFCLVLAGVVNKTGGQTDRHTYSKDHERSRKCKSRRSRSTLKKSQKSFETIIYAAFQWRGKCCRNNLRSIFYQRK